MAFGGKKAAPFGSGKTKDGRQKRKATARKTAKGKKKK